MRKTKFYVIVFLLYITIPSIHCKLTSHQTNVDKPLVWDMNRLERLKNNPGSNSSRSIIEEAEHYRKRESIVIINKTLTFEPTVHYYCSIGPYWWPDSNNSGKYINKDGVINPQSNNYDNAKLIDFANCCKSLSQAYYITGKKCYYHSFIKKIKAWFWDSKTNMIPTFAYSQVIPGCNNDMGRSTGMIDAYYFNIIIESVRLVDMRKQLSRKTISLLKKWFLEFAKDSEKRYGETLNKANNNIGIAHDVTLANIYLFAGEDDMAKKIVDSFPKRRLFIQIDDFGRQPEELKRTKAFSYSVFNLSHIIDLFFLAKYWYPNYFFDNGERVERAFNYLGKYVENPEAFPYQQLTDWETCKKNYQKQLLRLQELGGREAIRMKK